MDKGVLQNLPQKISCGASDLNCSAQGGGLERQKSIPTDALFPEHRLFLPAERSTTGPKGKGGVPAARRALHQWWVNRGGGDRGDPLAKKRTVALLAPLFSPPKEMLYLGALLEALLGGSI